MATLPTPNPIGIRPLGAEKFSTISSLINPRLAPERTKLNQLWEKLLLFDEHTWEADRSVSDPESQTSIRQGRASSGMFVCGNARNTGAIVFASNRPCENVMYSFVRF